MTPDAGAEPFDYTSTHNRAHALPRGYNSLRQQTFKDFKWLIVDNESTDGTEDVVRRAFLATTRREGFRDILVKLDRASRAACLCSRAGVASPA